MPSTSLSSARSVTRSTSGAYLSRAAFQFTPRIFASYRKSRCRRQASLNICFHSRRGFDTNVQSSTLTLAFDRSAGSLAPASITSISPGPVAAALVAVL
ncbi:hypothetical protein D3C81_1616190 [compost metagenome]